MNMEQLHQPEGRHGERSALPDDLVRTYALYASLSPEAREELKKIYAGTTIGNFLEEQAGDLPDAPRHPDVAPRNDREITASDREKIQSYIMKNPAFKSLSFSDLLILIKAEEGGLEIRQEN